MKLSHKLMIIMLCLGILMLSAVSIVSTYNKNILQETTLKNFEREATLLIRLIERNLFERYHDVQAFPSSLGVIKNGSLDYISTSQDTIADLNNFVINYKVYRYVIIINNNGEILAANSKNQFGKTVPSLNISSKKIRESKWFQRAIRGETLVPDRDKSAFVIGPQRFLIDERPTSYDLIFASQILDDNGEVAGLWVNVVDFSVVEDMVSESYELLSKRGFPGAELTILDKGGNIIVDYDPIGQNKVNYERNFEILGQINPAKNGVEGAKLAVMGYNGANISFHSRKKIEQVTGFAHSSGAYDYPGLGWSSMIRISVEEAFHDANDIYNNTIVLSLLFLTLLVISTFYLSRKITMPLNSLSYAVRKLSQGDENVELPKAESNDEIGVMIKELTNLRKIVVDRDFLSVETDKQKFIISIQGRAIDSTAIGIVVSDAKMEDQPVIYVNKAFEELTGYASYEVLGRNCRFLQGEATEEEAITALKEALKNQQSCSIAITNYKKSGSSFINNLRIDPMFNEEGELTHYIGMLTDITKEKEREERTKNKLEQEIILRTKDVIASENKLRTVFDTAIDGTIVIDRAGIITDANRALELTFGYTREQLIGNNVSMLMPTEYAEHHDQYLENFIVTKNKKLIGKPRKVSGLHRTGRIFPVELSIGEVWLEGSQAFVGVVKDITMQEDTKQREQKLQTELKEREFIYRAAFSQAAVGICRVDLSGRFLEVNERMCHIFATTENELLSTTFQNLSPHEYRESILDSMLNLIKRPNETYAKDVQLITAENIVIWVRLSVSIVCDQENFPRYFIVIVEDISARKHIESELAKESTLARSASEAKSRFLATMSHEIRTPMNGVIGMVDILNETSLDRDQKRMLSTIRDSSFSLLDIINDILDFSKIESGQMNIDPTDTHVLNIIEKTMEALWVNAKQKNVQIYLKYDLSTPEVIFCDPVRTRQIFLNLLGNAIKFSQKSDNSGVVIVSCSYNHQEEVLTVSIKDNGVGMSEEQVSKLFTPFTQADNSTTRKFGGTGLGLSITKSFIELMNGEISVVSEPMKGSDFSFSIPAPTKGSPIQSSRFDYSNVMLVLDINNETLLETCVATLTSINSLTVVPASEFDEKATKEAKNNVIILSDNMEQTPSEQNMGVIQINEDAGSSEGYFHPNKYVIGNHPLKPSELTFALSVLAGFDSPHFDWDEDFDAKLTEANGAEGFDSEDIRILCAEDQPTNQMVLSKQLDMLGLKHDMASNGKEALEMWKNNDYSMILTDCHMPEMDGFELTKAIRDLEQQLNLAPIAIIAITANALAGEADNCLSKGMDDYISKPVEFTKLKRVLSLRIRSIKIRDIKQTSPDMAEIDEVEGDDPFDESETQKNEHIDYDHIKSIIGSSDPEIMNAVLSIFWESIIKDMDKLASAIESQDPDAVRSIAHGAKGASASSGAISLSELFKTIEKNKNDFDLAKENFEQAKVALSKIEELLKKDGII